MAGVARAAAGVTVGGVREGARGVAAVTGLAVGETEAVTVVAEGKGWVAKDCEGEITGQDAVSTQVRNTLCEKTT